MIVKDAAGRELDIRPLTYQEEMTLAAGVGSPADSSVWWTMVKRACAVRSIAGVLIHMPQTRNQIKLLTKRLGVDGLKAVAKGLSEWVTETAPPVALVYRNVDEVELIDLLEIGSTFSDVPTWRGVAWLAAGIRKIGDEDIEFPSDLKSLRALVARLDDPAVQAALAGHDASAEDAVVAEDEKEAAKN